VAGNPRAAARERGAAAATQAAAAPAGCGGGVACVRRRQVRGRQAAAGAGRQVQEVAVPRWQREPNADGIVSQARQAVAQ